MPVGRQLFKKNQQIILNLSFHQLGVGEKALKAIEELGFKEPTPVQQQAIPVLLSNERDFVGLAQTGTGKTAAFAIPILQLLHQQDMVANRPKHIRSLILTPTRELAIQIGESFEKYGRYTGLRHTTVYGGVPQFQQVRSLQRGVDILIATPGRLLDLISQRHAALHRH